METPELLHRPLWSHPAKDRPGWETTYDDFRQLLGDLQWRAVVSPLLREWYGCEVTGRKGHPKIHSASGERISLVDLHRSIQNDPDLRYHFYQRKMSCFHWDDFAERLYAETVEARDRGASG